MPTVSRRLPGRSAALAGALGAASHREFARRVAHVEQPPAVALGGRADRLDVGKPRMHTAGDVHARRHGAHDGVDPGLGDEAASVGDPDDHGLRPRARRRIDRHVGKAEGGPAAVEPELAEAPLGPPLEHAAGGFRRQIVARVAEKEQIGPVHWAILAMRSAHAPIMPGSRARNSF